MEFRDLIVKLYDEKQSVETTEEATVEVKESNLPSLKKIFEQLSSNLKIEPEKQETSVLKKDGEVVGKVTDPMLAKTMAQAIKDGQITMNDQPMKEEELDEKWAGDAKVKPTGQYKDKTKEELKSMLAKLHKSGPHDKDSPAAKKMRQINFALRAKGGWKSGEGAAMKEESLDEKAKNPYAIGMAAAMKRTGDTPPLKKSTIVKAHDIAKNIKKKTEEAEIPKSGPDYGAGLGAGRNDNILEITQVKESMNKKHRAAYQEGQADGLRERACRVKHYEDMEEAKHYYEGYKTGLDECYGMGVKNEPITGMEEAVATMEAGLDEMDKTAYMQHKAKTTPGDTFKAFGQEFKDSDVLETESLAFESLDKQLNELLKEDVEETVNEGLSVSMSTGNQGAPDSVSVTGTEDEAGKLLAFIKQVGLGGMGDAEEPAAVVTTVSDYGAPKMHHSDMKGLLQKIGSDDDDYKDEDLHGNEDMKKEPCDECGGTMEENHVCNKEAVDEVLTKDQTLYATTSESDGSEDDGFDASARNTELDNVGKPASGGATNEDGAEAPGSNSVGQAEQEEAEDVNEESTDKMDQHAEKAGKKVAKDIEYDEGHKGKDDNKAEKAGKKVTKDIEYDDKKDREEKNDTMSESSFLSLYKKLAWIAEESTQKKDKKAEKAGKKVTKDIEYDEGHKGKDDDKAEKAGKKVTKDIEYDDKKDKKKKVDEWANNAGGKGTDTAFEQDIEFMTKTIAGGLNKPKVTGQTTIPVITGQDARTGEKEDLNSWIKLAGIKPAVKK